MRPHLTIALMLWLFTFDARASCARIHTPDILAEYDNVVIAQVMTSEFIPREGGCGHLRHEFEALNVIKGNDEDIPYLRQPGPDCEFAGWPGRKFSITGRYVVLLSQGKEPAFIGGCTEMLVQTYINNCVFDEFLRVAQMPPIDDQTRTFCEQRLEATAQGMAPLTEEGRLLEEMERTIGGLASWRIALHELDNEAMPDWFDGHPADWEERQRMERESYLESIRKAQAHLDELRRQKNIMFPGEPTPLD